VNILLVEDDARVADFIRRGMRSEGWQVSVATDGETALAMLDTERFDAVVLDRMLPGISGLEVCRRIRARLDPQPILMLSALGDVEERVAGLKTGADDYLAKPFDFNELLVRIQALTRRTAGGFNAATADGSVLTLGAIRFDTASLRVHCDGRLVSLTPIEREILKLFLQNPGRVLSRERILNKVWSVNKDPQTNIIDVYVRRLRQKLGVAGDLIETVRGAGYRCSGSDRQES
jgi:DNA-binding response OmpR family regulator